MHVVGPFLVIGRVRFLKRVLVARSFSGDVSVAFLCQKVALARLAFACAVFAFVALGAVLIAGGEDFLDDVHS